MKIEKVKEHIGAIVTGIDLAHPVDGATQRKLYDAVLENVVLVIRGQEHLTPGQVQAAGEMFGELMEDQNRRYLVDGFPLISVLDNRHTDSKGQPAKVGANATWHTDHTNQELPPKFTMLYAVAVPGKGDDVKLRIADAKIENTLISSARIKTGNPDIVKAQLEATKPPTVHPLVRTHPEAPCAKHSLGRLDHERPGGTRDDPPELFGPHRGRCHVILQVSTGPHGTVSTFIIGTRRDASTSASGHGRSDDPSASCLHCSWGGRSTASN
jgi:alpha-ketoglutarate-dependent taurine dioxygenase